MKESELLVELGASFRALDGYWHKEADMPRLPEYVECPKCKAKVKVPGPRFSPPKPYDATAHLWPDKGYPPYRANTWFAIETKVARSGNPAVGLKRVAEHQWKALREVAARGMAARVLVLVENRKVEGITNEFFELAVYTVTAGPQAMGFGAATEHMFLVNVGLDAKDVDFVVSGPHFLQREDGRWPVEKL